MVSQETGTQTEAIEPQIDPYKWQKKYHKERRLQDPEWRAKRSKENVEYIKRRCENDPEYQEKRKANARVKSAARRAKQKEEEEGKTALGKDGT